MEEAKNNVGFRPQMSKILAFFFVETETEFPKTCPNISNVSLSFERPQETELCSFVLEGAEDVKAKLSVCLKDA